MLLAPRAQRRGARGRGDMQFHMCAPLCWTWAPLVPLFSTLYRAESVNCDHFFRYHTFGLGAGMSPGGFCRAKLKTLDAGWRNIHHITNNDINNNKSLVPFFRIGFSTGLGGIARTTINFGRFLFQDLPNLFSFLFCFSLGFWRGYIGAPLLAHTRLRGF